MDLKAIEPLNLDQISRFAWAFWSRGFDVLVLEVKGKAALQGFGCGDSRRTHWLRPRRPQPPLQA